MITSTNRIKNWISASFQLITVALISALLLLQIKLQKDIKDLNSRIDQVESKLSTDINDTKRRLSSDLEDAKRSLSHEIDDVRGLVILYRN